jgi:hypothetical protein
MLLWPWYDREIMIFQISSIDAIIIQNFSNEIKFPIKYFVIKWKGRSEVRIDNLRFGL